MKAASGSDKAFLDEGGRDIAFKPTIEGWGYTPAFGSGWDRIFQKKRPSAAADAPSSSAPAAAPAAAPAPAPSSTWPPPKGAASAADAQQAKLDALAAAHRLGALPYDLYAEAKRRLQQ